MYYVSKLSKPSLDFIKRMSSSLGNRSTTFPIALGYVIGNIAALPNQEVEDIEGYYRMNCKDGVSRYVNIINEVLPVNYKQAEALALAFYKYRYRAMAPKSIPLAFNPDTAIEDFFSLSTFFSKDVLEAIEKNPEALTTYINGLTTFFAEVQKKEFEDADAASSKSNPENAETSYVAP